MWSEVASGVGYGAIGGAVSAVAAAPITGLVASAGGSVNTTLAISAGIDALAAGGAAALLGQNPQAAVTAAANEYLNNCAALDDACKRLAEQGASNPMSSTALAPACGDGSAPCNMQVLQAMMQARGANSGQALANMQVMAPYAAGTLGVALLGPDALAAAGLAGVVDYSGNAVSYGLGKIGLGPNVGPPSLAGSYTAGVIGGLAYPFLIADKTIAGLGIGGKIAANGFNAGVAGVGAFSASAITNQPNPDLSGGIASSTTAVGSWLKAVLPAPLGSIMNQMMQGAAGPIQNVIQPPTK